MLHILLTIIKIPFILLAVVLLLLLLIMLLVSFVPLRYRAAVKKGEGLYASGTVTWLLHFISVRFEYADKQTGLQVKLAGFPLIGGKAKKKRQKKLPEEEEAVQDAEFPETDSETAQEPEIVKELEEVSEEPDVSEDEDEASEEPDVSEDGEEASEEPDVSENGEEASEEPDVSENGEEVSEGLDVSEDEEEASEEPDVLEDEEEASEDGDVTPTEPEVSENIFTPAEDGSGSAAQDAHPRRETDDTENRSGRSGNIFGKIISKLKDVIQKIRDIFSNISRTAADIKSKLDYYRRLWYDEHTQSAWRHLKKEVCCLLRHYRPRKANGHLRFGFEDPALTGELLGVLCILQALSGNNLIAEADFEQKVFEGDFTLKGHIRVCHFLRAALALVFDKHCRITFKRIRKLL